MAEGDVLSIQLSGAGGYGPASERSGEAILDDIEDGYVTPDAAVRDYPQYNAP